jgi:4-aminobutyrate--pyruvate transaminase
MSEPFLKGLHAFASHPLVGEARGAGLIGAVELVADKASKAGFERPGTGLYLAERCHDHGLIIRPIGDIIAFCPPLVISETDIREMFARFGRALDETAAWIAAGRQ